MGGSGVSGGKPNLLDIARGNVRGQSLMYKFGRLDGVNTSETFIWQGATSGGAYAGHMTAATTVRIKAGGNAEDDQDAGGNAREVTVVGLDANWEDQTVTLTPEGADASANTTATFIRVFRMYVSSVGTYGASNAAAIILEKSAGSADLCAIPAGYGQSQMAMYTVPAGKTAYIIDAWAHINSVQAADVAVAIRPNADDTATPFSGASRKIMTAHAVKDLQLSRDMNFGASLPAKTDIFGLGNSTGSTADIDLSFTLLLIDD